VQLRPLQPIPGRLAWISQCPGEVLPNGLLDQQIVVVLAVISPSEIAVRNAPGDHFEINIDSVDCGYEFLLQSGRWTHESDPAVYSEIAAKGIRVGEHRQLVEKVLARNQFIYRLLHSS
jgi:hypothetical protein